MPGGLLLRLTFQVTEQQRRPVRLRHLPQSIVQCHLEFLPRHVGYAGCFAHICRLLLTCLPTVILAPGLQGQPVRHGVQPARDRFNFADGAGFAGENQEGRLERILGIVLVAADAPAHAIDHRPMPYEESDERRFLLPADESLEEFAIAGVVSRLCIHHAAKMPQNRA